MTDITVFPATETTRTTVQWSASDGLLHERSFFTSDEANTFADFLRTGTDDKEILT